MFRYRTGRRTKPWNKNCIALGLASGFLEPVESTSIHLAMSAIFRLMRLLPQGEILDVNVEEFNRQTLQEMDQVRNFIVLHYYVTQRKDTPFWRYCASMDVPKELQHRIDLFKKTGAIQLGEKELFRIDSWVQVMLGQHIGLETYHPIVDLMGDKELAGFLETIRQQVKSNAAKIPSHQEFIEQYCKTPVSMVADPDGGA